MKYDLNYILSPLGEEDFFENYYEKKPLFIKREQSGYYTNIVNIGDINNFIGHANLLYPSVRIVKSSEKVAAENYTFSITSSNSVVSDNIVDKDKLFFYFYNGYTIILNSYERQNLNLLYLRHEFEKAFYSKAQCNIYLTPINSQGFPAHFDLHDVFVLQLHGSKEWQVYSSPIEFPDKNIEIEELNWTKPEQYLTAFLQAGDLLYIPRGFVHEAKSQDELSLHLTLGIPTFKYADLLTEFISGIENNLFFRKSLPRDFNAQQIELIFKKYLAEYLTKQDLTPLIDNIQTRFVDTRLNDTEDRLNDYLKIGAINPSTILQIRKGVFYQLKKNGHEIELRYNNKLLKFPLFTETALKCILKKEKFSIKDLDKIDNNSKLILCRKLITEGLLAIIT